MIKAVIFDYGGVIHPSCPCRENVAKGYGVSLARLEKAIDGIIKKFRKGFITEDEFFKKLSLILDKPVPKNKKSLWREKFEKNFYLYPQMKDLIKKLKLKGIKTAVLSNVIEPHTEIIKRSGGYKSFDVVILSCKVGLDKPDPAIYLLTAKKLNVKPEECLFIDDKESNLVPAEKLRMKTILAKNPKQVVNDILEKLRLDTRDRV